jgi:hypothetical protein
VESSCEFGIEPWGSIKYWKLSSSITTGSLLSSTQVHTVSQLVSTFLYIIMSATFKRSYDNIVIYAHNFKDSRLLHVCNCLDVKNMARRVLLFYIKSVRY